MAHDTDAFRTRYRAGISPRYSGPLHALWVACFGLTLLAWFARRLVGWFLAVRQEGYLP